MDVFVDKNNFKMPFIDAHCHCHVDRIQLLIPTIINEALAKGMTHLVVNSTSPQDFDKVLKLKEKYNMVIPSFGIHPWYIDKSSIEASLQQLYSFCNSLDCFYCIGEIGMDKVRQKTCPMDIQEMVFRKQIQFAVSKSLPFCVHCVKCVGIVYEVLKSELPDQYPFLMHGYSGSADYVLKLSQLGGYFSISNYFLNLSPKRRCEMETTIRKIPLDRLLFESDAPDMVFWFMLIIHS